MVQSISSGALRTGGGLVVVGALLVVVVASPDGAATTAELSLPLWSAMLLHPGRRVGTQELAHLVGGRADGLRLAPLVDPLDVREERGDLVRRDLRVGDVVAVQQEHR